MDLPGVTVEIDLRKNRNMRTFAGDLQVMPGQRGCRTDKKYFKYGHYN
jgi:hypothetical protein